MDRRTGKRVKQSRNLTLVETSLDKLFERFVIAKTAEGRSKGTLDQYQWNYWFLVEYLDAKKIDRDVRNVTKEVIRDYIVWMMNEKVRFEGSKYKSDAEQTVGLSPVTINTRLKTLRTFFRFLKQEQLNDVDPMETVKKVEEDENEIVILTADELRILLKMPNQKKYGDFRDYVLMNVLLDTFLRSSRTSRPLFTRADRIAFPVNIRHNSFRVSWEQK